MAEGPEAKSTAVKKKAQGESKLFQKEIKSVAKTVASLAAIPLTSG
ncbi:MAG: hypothetical protein JSV17_03875 [Candidatus Aminicenantes bacterium]|nr:MAG: hypothetical protein JSV17_03875 [Candidatus Aminicenantes bacterium]